MSQRISLLASARNGQVVGKSAGIEHSAEEGIQMQNNNGQLSVQIGRGNVHVGGFEPVASPAETPGQGQVFVGVTQLAQQGQNAIDQGPGLADLTEGGGSGGAVPPEPLPQQAFELAAIYWPLWIDAAAGTVESGTRLVKPERTSTGGVGAANRPVVDHRAREPQTQRSQFRHEIARLNLHIGEDSPVAAQPASHAQVFSHGNFHRVIL